MQVVRHNVDEAFSSDAVERQPGTPDVDFQDVTSPELTDIWRRVHVVENKNSRWRGVPDVTVEDVYPELKPYKLDEIDMSEAQYQGDRPESNDYRPSADQTRRNTEATNEFIHGLRMKMEAEKKERADREKALEKEKELIKQGYNPAAAEFMILIEVFKSIAWFSFLWSLFRSFLFLVDLGVVLYKMAKEAGWTATKTWARERPKKFWLLDIAFVTSFLIALVAIQTVMLAFVNMLFLFFIDVATGDFKLCSGLWYGVRAGSCFAQALARLPIDAIKMKKRSKDLDPHYVPVAIHEDGLLCLCKEGNAMRTVFVRRGKDFSWQGWAVPLGPTQIVGTPFDNLQRINYGPLVYAIYWDRLVLVVSLDKDACEPWDMVNHEAFPSAFIGPRESTTFTGALVGRAHALEDGDDIDDTNRVRLLREDDPEEKADDPEPVYQSRDGEFTSLMSKLDDMALVTNMPTISVVTDVVALVLLVSETQSKTVLISQSVALLSRYPKMGDFVVREIRDLIAKFDDDDGEVAKYQGFSTGFKDSEVGASFFEMISLFTAAGTAATLGIVDVGWIKSLQKVATHLSAFDTLDDLMKRFLKFVKSMYEVLRKCYDAGSFAPLWEPVTMNPTRYVKLAGELIGEQLIRDSSNTAAYLHQCHKFDVDLRNGQISEGGRIEMMEELYNLGSRFDNLKRGENDQFIYQGIVTVRHALRKEIDAARTRTELGRFKEEPYSLGLFGPPGIGKSFMVRSSQRLVAARLKVKNSASIGFQWAVGQKFADGLTSAKRVYVFDDVDQKVGVPAYGDSSPYIDFLLVRNSKPTTANMADVSDKGKYAYNALMVMWVSNKLPTYKEVKNHISDVHAFARRFNHAWWVDLAQGVTRAHMERGEVHDKSWVFTEYQWNPSAKNDSDELFVKTGRVLTSRLAFLELTSKAFNAKIDGEAAKMAALNAEDLPQCKECGVSFSDHFRPCVGNWNEGELSWQGTVNPLFTAVPVYQGPDDEPRRTVEVNPMAAPEVPLDERILSDPTPLERMALRGVVEGPKITEERAGQIVSYWIVGLYVLHVLTMFWGMWFVTLALETVCLSGAVAFMRLDEDGKIKVALMLFPKSTLTWLIARGVVQFRMPALEKAVVSLRSSAALEKLKTFVPIMAALALVMWLWNQSRATYQSVKVVGEDDIVREQPKKEQWLLMENTPRNVSTPEARTYSETGFKRSVVSCIAKAKKGNREFPLHYINSKTWMTNAHHLLSGAPPRYSEVSADMVFDDSFELEVTIGSFSGKFTVDTKKSVAQAPGRDVVFIRLDDMLSPGAGIYKMLGGDIDVNSEYSGAELCDTTDASKPFWRKAVGLAKYKKSRAADKVMLTYDVEGGNAFGLCGSLVCAPTTGGGWLVLAAHSAGLQGLSLAEPLTRSMVESTAARLYPQGGVRRHTDVVAYQSGLLREPGQMGPDSDLVVQGTFKRTHLSSAVDSGAKVLAVGTISGFHARTFKSDVVDAPFKGEVVAFAMDRGISTSYVSPKTLLTRKDGDKITSPYTTVLTMRANKRGPKEALDWAVADWEKPVLEMLSETKPWRMYSYTEVFSGTDDLTPTNLRTSTGPPYNSKKSNYMVKNTDGSWLIEPNLAEDARLLDESLARGEIPGVVINAAVKAEAISAQKAEECRQRVLEVGPQGHSAALKRRIGFLVPVIKANKSLFEMSIGMNVYGLDAERLYERMSKGECFDGDLKMQDGKTSTQYMDAITGLILRMCSAAGMPEDVLEETRLLLLSFGDRLMCILGDIFIINGGNPTGWYGTALYASFVTILLLRCCFYMGHLETFGTPPVFTYRSEVETEVQGDDNINCVLHGSTARWFSGKSVTLYAPLFGHVYTGTAKDSGEVQWVSTQELSYLKRSFKRIKDQVVMALELKSIAKQLMFYRKPAGGSVDSQLAVNVTNASRELSLHGPVVYEEWKGLLSKIAEFGEISASRFLNVQPWEETFDGVLKGSLSELPMGEMDFSDAVFQSDEGANVVLSVASTTEVVQAEGTTAPVVATTAVSDPGAAQHRAVRVWTQTLSTADVSGTVLVAFEIVQLIKGNTQLADVFERYYNFSFDSITLKIQHNSSASMYGSYAVVCTPSQSNTGSTLANQPAIHNVHNCEYKYVFNPANNEDIEFTIPWFGCIDKMPTAAGDNAGPTWYVSVICLVPLADAMNSTGAAVSTMSFIANYNGVKFGAPQYQGKKDQVKISSVMQAAGSVGAAIMSVVPGAQPFLPIAMGLAAGGKMLSEAGHTRHRAPKLAERMVPTAATGFGPVDGEDRGMVADWVQSAQVSTDVKISSAATAEDTMSFAFLAGRSHLISLPTITSLLPTGTVLASIPVTPYITRASGSGGRCFHPFAHATALFSYWRATMEYDISFACNALQSGTVFAYWSSSYVTTGTVVSGDFISGAAGCIVEFDPAKTTTIKVPWMATRPLAMVDRMLMVDGSHKTRNGHLIIVVMNPLSAPYAASIAMMVTMRVGQDVVVGGTKSYRSDQDAAAVPLEDQLTVQGTLTQSSAMNEECWVVASQPPTELDGVFVSAAVTSVKALCQRYCLYPGSGTGISRCILADGSTASTMYSTRLSFPFYPTPPSVLTSQFCFAPWPIRVVRSAGATTFTTGTEVKFTNIGWLSAMYLGMRGGMSHKVFSLPVTPTSTVNVVRVVRMISREGIRSTNLDTKTSATIMTTSSGVTSNPGAQWYPSHGPGVQSEDFVLTYNSMRRFYPCTTIPSITSDECRWANLEIESSGDFLFQIWSAGSADFSFVGFRFSPMTANGE
jgi:hypothetical protein